jgi:hypothetical protein
MENDALKFSAQCNMKVPMNTPTSVKKETFK